MKNRGPSTSVKLFALISLAMLFYGTANAQWPTITKPDLEVGFFWEQRNILLQGEHLEDDELRFGIDIRQRGYWYDPRIVAFNYFLRPAYSIQEFTSTGRRNVELLNYRIGVDILRGAITPVEVSLGFSRSDNEYKATLAGDTKSSTQQNSLELRWKFAPFPMQFTAVEQDYYRRSTSLFSESIVERDDTFRKFRIRGKSSKLSMDLQHETRQSKIQGRESDLENDTARLAHRFRWGKGSLVDTRYDYRRRAQAQEYVTNSFSQLISVQHTENVGSNLNYRLETASGALDTDLLDTRYTLSHQLYRNLNTSVFAYHSERSSDFESFTERGAGMGLGYNKNFFGTNVKLGADYRRSNLDRNTVEGVLEVIDEDYTIPADGTFVLADRLIDRDSVIITDASGGIVYIEGIDYALLDFGDGLLIVSVTPGGELEPNQTVLISYLATQNPSGESEETMVSYDVSIRRDGWSFSHSALHFDDDLIEGFLPSGLDSRRENHTRVTYSWNARNADFALAVQRDTWHQTDFDLKSLTLTGSVSMAISQSANALLSLTHQDSENEEQLAAFPVNSGIDRLNTEFDNLRLSVNWRVTANLDVRSSVTAWKRNFEYEQDRVRSYDEEYISAEVEFDYRFRRFSANLRLFYNDSEIRRTRPNTDSLRTDDGFRLAVRRSF